MDKRARTALGMAVAVALAFCAWLAGAGAPAPDADAGGAAAGSRDAGDDAAAAARPPIAFTLNVAGEESVAGIGAGGRDFGLVMRSAGGPAWSRDGRLLAVGERSGEQSDITVLGFDGSPPRRVTSGPHDDRDPAFSPDGGRIAFSRAVRTADGALRAGIQVVGVDGSDPRALTSGRAFDGDPDWSPDGRLIAFTRVAATRRGRLVRSILLHDVERGVRRRLVRGGGFPAFSPDGRRVAFVSYRDGAGATCFHECSASGEIHVVALDGGDDVRLTRSRADDTAPAWAPGGRHLLFSSDRADPRRHDYELYAMTRAGRCVTRLTNSSSWSRQPAFDPLATARPPCRRDGVAPGARRPRSDVELAALRDFERYTVFWLGHIHRGLLLGHAEPGGEGFDDSVDLVYDDCGRIARRCPAGVQVQVRPLCWYLEGPAPVRLRRVGSERGAPVFGLARGGGDGWMEVHTGDSAVRVIAGTRADALRAVRRLRPLDGALGPLGPPDRRC